MQIEHPLYGGTYQVKTPVVTEEVDQDTEVQADEKTAQKPTEKAPSFITE